MEIWATPTRKNLFYRFPIMVVAAALASAPVLIKPLPFLPLDYLTGEVIPRLRDSFSGWMTTPYLFFLVNTIIIVIFAISRSQHNLDWTEYHVQPQDHFQEKVKEISLPSETGEEEVEEEEVEEEEDSVSKEPEMCTESAISLFQPSSEAENLETSAQIDDKMLSVARFASRRSKGKKMSQSLKVNHVEKDREETLESVWKKISEGRRPPLARHLRSAPQAIGNGSNSRLLKSEKTEESALHLALGRGRSGGSTGQDELNRRVEAFIAKFNQEIKLQKQDSLVGYADMINRGAI